MNKGSKTSMKTLIKLGLLASISFALVGCSEEKTAPVEQQTTEPTQQANDNQKKTQEKQPAQKEEKTTSSKNEFKGYKLIKANACDLSGSREANVVVDIGFGNREYWAFTNQYGQLIRVTAKKITLQNDRTEQVTSSGRYCRDEAKVPGVERKDLDEGHVIADSLGGVSNAYNITPQDSTLNRHGDQAYMEDAIRKAGGATDFEAIITYPNTKTQIPSRYKYTYTIKGNRVVDEYANGNPDQRNEELGLTKKQPTTSSKPQTKGDVSAVDTDGNGQVTIKEAKAAGFKMPITKDHWLYP